MLESGAGENPARKATYQLRQVLLSERSRGFRALLGAGG